MHTFYACVQCVDITPNIVTLSLSSRDDEIHGDGDGKDYQPVDEDSASHSRLSWGQLNKVASVARNWFRPTARTTSAVKVDSQTAFLKAFPKPCKLAESTNNIQKVTYICSQLHHNKQYTTPLEDVARTSNCVCVYACYIQYGIIWSYGVHVLHTSCSYIIKMANVRIIPSSLIPSSLLITIQEIGQEMVNVYEVQNLSTPACQHSGQSAYWDMCTLLTSSSYPFSGSEHAERFISCWYKVGHWFCSAYWLLFCMPPTPVKDCPTASYYNYTECLNSTTSSLSRAMAPGQEESLGTCYATKHCSLPHQ